MITEINIHRLTPHPESSNFMDDKRIEKLRHLIQRGGHYEPLTVRKHPFKKGKYQIINGHHRLRVLKELGETKVHCVVWHIDDDLTRLYLATLNRLAGKELPERRGILLKNLLQTYSVNALAQLLPDTKARLDKWSRARAKRRPVAAVKGARKPPLKIPATLFFLLEESEAKEVEIAINRLMKEKRLASSRQALIYLARHYLKRS